MEIGGAQRVAQNLCTELSSRGHSVDLVLVEAKGEILEELPDDISVIDLGARRVLNSIPALARYLRRQSPDVVYSMMTEVNLVALLSHSLSRSEAAIVISEHNVLRTSINKPKERLLISLASLLYPRADHIIVVSDGVKENILSTLSVKESILSRIYNPFDINRIQHLARKPLSHPWLSASSSKVVISAGRHVPQKGFDTLLTAIADIDDEDVKLILLGTGPETEHLKHLSCALGIGDRVDFEGFVDNPYSYISKSDVFVLSSDHEGFGNVIVESLACGCPVVSTDCPSGPSEILQGGKYGSLVPVGDAHRMSDEIRSTLANPPCKGMLQSRAKDFSVDSVVDQYEKIFETVL